MNEVDARKARTLRMLASIPSPTRPQARRRGLALLIGSVSVALTIFQIAGGFEHGEGRPWKSTLLIAGGWATFCSILSWVVLRRRSTLGRPPVFMLLAALATPTALIAWTHLFDGTYVEPFSRVGWRCLTYNLSIAALPLASFLALRRGIEPRGPGALGAAIGAVCGAWAGLLVDFWCPLVNLPHVLVGHALPIAILVVTGAIVGRNRLDARS